MNSLQKSRKSLDLETDLLLTPDDFQTMRRRPQWVDRDLSSYLNFLEEVGAFKTQKTGVKIYGEQFEL
jgi:hypothetical protein